MPRRDRRGEHPHGHHGREVERRDARHDTQRLADLVDVDARARLLAVRALHEVRDAARELEVLEAAGDLAQRVRRHLAVLRGEQRGELPAVMVDQVPDAEQDVGALRERRGAPGRERAGRSRDRPSTSSTDAKSTHLAWRPVAGSNTGPRRPDAPATTRASDPVPDRRQLGGRGGVRTGRLGDLGHGRHLARATAVDPGRPTGGRDGVRESTPGPPSLPRPRRVGAASPCARLARPWGARIALRTVGGSPDRATPASPPRRGPRRRGRTGAGAGAQGRTRRC